MRLRARLVLLVLASVVPILCLGLGREYLNYREERARVDERLLATARGLALALERDQQVHVAALETLAAAPTLRAGDFTAFQAQAEDFLRRQPPGAILGVTDGTGQLLRIFGKATPATGALATGALPRRAMLETTQAVFATGQPAMANLHVSFLTHDKGFSVDVPVFRDGQVVYGLFLRLTPAVLADLVARQRLPPGAIAAIIDAAGTIVARVPNTDRFVGQSAVAPLRARLADDHEGVAEADSLEGTPSIAAFSRAAPFNWSAAVGVTRTEMLAPAREEVLRTFAASVVVLLVGMGLALLAARRITVPIAALRRLATQETVPSAIQTGLPETDDVAAALASAAAGRRAALADLSDSEQRFRILFEHAPTSTFLVDPDTSAIVGCNAAAGRLLGYTTEELRRLTVADIQAVLTRDQVLATGKAAAAGKVMQFESRYRTKSGALRDVMIAIAPVRVSGRTLVYSTQLDITDLRRTEARLRENEQRLRLATEAADLGTWHRDVATGDMFWSERFRSLLGVPPEEPPTVARLLAAIHPGDRERIERIARAAWDGGETFDVECRVVWPDGSVHWMRAKGGAARDTETGQILRVQGVAISIDREKRAAERLAESEARLRLFIDRAPAAIAMFDTEMRYLAASRRYLVDYGLDAEEPATLAGRSHYALFPDLPAHWRDIHRRVLDGEMLGAEDDTFVHPNGQTEWLRWEMVPWRDSHGAIGGALLFSEFVTARKAAEHALAESEERLHLAREGAELGIWDWDLATGAISWSERQWELHGLAPRPGGPARGEWRGIMHPDDRPRVQAQVRMALADRTHRFETEYRARMPDGAWRWLIGRANVIRNANGVPIRVVGVNMDITPRKEAEEAARQVAGRLRLTHQMAGTGTFEWPVGAAETIISEQYAVICGLPPGTTREPWRHAQARIHPEDRPALAALVQGSIEGRLPGYATEFRIIRTNDRAVRLVAAQAEVLRYDGVPRLTGVLRDVTEERAAQAELRRLNRDLEARVREEVSAREAAQRRAAHAERIQALGQIAGGIAHDFNNVLQAVSGGAALIERRAEQPDSVRRHVRMISDAARRGAAITSRLLAFARRGDLRAERLDAAAMLTDLSEVLTHTLGGAVACRVQADPGLPALLADRGQLETVLVNLATNARDAMPNGGVLTLRATAEVVAQDRAHVAGLGPGPYVRIDVADTGTGMTQEVLARVSEPFFTTKAPGKGTGLGLAMARGFAEQSGGGLAIESQVEQGTVVTLWLPQAQVAPASRRPEKSGSRIDRPFSLPLVLLVDDDPIVREVLAESLDEAGYAVLQADGGEAALALLGTRGPVDILVSDLTMPGLDGLGLIKAAQERVPGLPAILLTGYVGDGASLAVGGAISGSFSLLRKPVSGAHLVDRIAALLATRSGAVS